MFHLMQAIFPSRQKRSYPEMIFGNHSSWQNKFRSGFFGGKDVLKLGLGDAALGFRAGLGPDCQGKDGMGQPAEIHGEIVKAVF